MADTCEHTKEFTKTPLANWSESQSVTSGDEKKEMALIQRLCLELLFSQGIVCSCSFVVTLFGTAGALLVSFPVAGKNIMSLLIPSVDRLSSHVCKQTVRFGPFL